jgi:chromosome segregation ATPase
MVWFPQTDIEHAMQDEIDALIAERDNLKKACTAFEQAADAYRTERDKLKEDDLNNQLRIADLVERVSKLKEEVERLRERVRFADQDCAAECAGLRGEVERLTEACDGYLGHAAGLRAENAKLVERVSELERALGEIEFASGDQPAAMNMPEADWYRSRFYDCVATASAALSRTSEEA